MPSYSVIYLSSLLGGWWFLDYLVSTPTSSFRAWPRGNLCPETESLTSSIWMTLTTLLMRGAFATFTISCSTGNSGVGKQSMLRKLMPRVPAMVVLCSRDQRLLLDIASALISFLVRVKGPRFRFGLGLNRWHFFFSGHMHENLKIAAIILQLHLI